MASQAALLSAQYVLLPLLVIAAQTLSKTLAGRFSLGVATAKAIFVPIRTGDDYLNERGIQLLMTISFLFCHPPSRSILNGSRIVAFRARVLIGSSCCHHDNCIFIVIPASFEPPTAARVATAIGRPDKARTSPAVLGPLSASSRSGGGGPPPDSVSPIV